MYKLICIARTPNHKSKFQITLYDSDTERTKTIRFGATGMGDYPSYSKENHAIADERKRLYLQRHQGREDWTKTGILTPGFWARHILWNKRSIEESLQDTIKRFNLFQEK
jgi:hypothetical protein